MASCVLEYFVDLQKTCTLVLCLFCNSAGRNSYLKIGICQLVFLICFIVFKIYKSKLFYNSVFYNTIALTVAIKLSTTVDSTGLASSATVIAGGVPP